MHSGVEFCDSSILAQMGVPDMRVPIEVALAYPDRLETGFASLDFFGKASELTFEKPDMEVFRCLRLAIAASREGGSSPVVMNAANEILVQAFLDKRIGFTEIAEGIEQMMESHQRVKEPDLDAIVAIDRETREMIR
jgi:1-deoxy-D-xylulose-5-phosphate reductoisomerase